MKKIVVMVLCTLLLVGCGNKVVEKTDAERFKEEYEALNGTQNLVDMHLDADIKIKYVSTQEAVNLLKEGTGIIYFGFPRCPWCRNAVPVLLDVAKENHLEVAYLDPSGLRNSDDELFSQIMGILYEHLQEDENGQKTLYVPDVYFIKEGKIVGHQLGTVESQDNPTVPMTEEQRQELTNIYKGFVDQIK